MKNPNLVPDDENVSYRRMGHNVMPARRNMVDYQPTPPTLDADWLLSAVIDRSGNTIARRRFSQTPLSPNLLVDMIEIYPAAAEVVLEARIHEIADDIGLQDRYKSIVMHEVKSEHNRRVTGNVEAAERLGLAISGTELSQSDAELIWKARTGDATISETGELLLRYPIMRSIEAAKHTQPFNVDAHAEMTQHIRKGLWGLAQLSIADDNADLVWFQTYEKDERKVRNFEISSNEEDQDIKERQQKHIKGFKQTLAEFTDGKTTIQLISKEPVLRIPEKSNPERAPDNLIHLEDGYFHSHFISMSCYWSVKTK